MSEKTCSRCGYTGGSREDGYHGTCFLTDQRDTAVAAVGELLAVLRPIAEGCGHERCHARKWITAARRAVRKYGGAP